jgi:hypothetical protein
MAGSKDSKKKRRDDEGPVDLAARVGTRAVPDEPAPAPPPPVSGDATPANADPGRPTSIGGDEPPPPPILPPPGAEDEQKSAPIISVRGAPSVGEIDLVVTPLPTPDDWHRFELALRKVRGVTQLRPEYYRHGVAKMRVSYEGTERLATMLRAGVPGYRVRVIGEDRATIQILVSSETEERRPG